MKNIYKRLLVIFMMLGLSLSVNAQDPDDPLSDDPGEPVAPIGDYVPLMLIAAIGLGYVVIKRRTANES